MKYLMRFVNFDDADEVHKKLFEAELTVFKCCQECKYCPFTYNGECLRNVLHDSMKNIEEYIEEGKEDAD